MDISDKWFVLFGASFAGVIAHLPVALGVVNMFVFGIAMLLTVKVRA